MTTTSTFFSWAMPGIVFTVAFGFAACTDKQTPSCPSGMGTGAGTTTTTATTTMVVPGDGGSDDSGAGESVPGASLTTSLDPDDTFDHFNDPGASGGLDPFQILQERAIEGPPEIATRMHSCTKVAYASLGAFLTSRGVDLSKTSSGTGPQTAGELYKQGG